MKNFTFLLIPIFCYFLNLQAQEPEKVLKSIFDEALTDTTSYQNLRLLCKNHKGRITGSTEANKAVDFMAELMQQMQLDRVEKQPVTFPRWVRGEAEKAFIADDKGIKTEVPVTALGMSIGTGDKGLMARIVEVHSFKELEELGTKNISGKIRHTAFVVHHRYAAVFRCPPFGLRYL